MHSCIFSFYSSAALSAKARPIAVAIVRQNFNIFLMFIGPCIIVIVEETPEDGHINARNMLSI